MKLKTFSLITLAGGVLLWIIAIVWVMTARYGGNGVGIIGGADIPTYLFEMTRLWRELFCFLLFGAALIVTGVFCLIFAKTVKTHCTIPTSAIAFGLSVVGALGLLCVLVWYDIVVFGKMSRHPIEYPFSIALGLTCLLAFVALIIWYVKQRKGRWSVKGVAIDIGTALLYLPAFWWLFFRVYQWLS